MRISLELVAAEARKVEAKSLLRYCLTVHMTGWKLILSQNICKLPNVVVEGDPDVTDFKCIVHQLSC